VAVKTARQSTPPGTRSRLPRPERADESNPELVEKRYRHVVSFGPDCVLETAQQWYLSSGDLLRLATRVNDLIERASKPKREGEPRDVTSYRARITEARVRTTHGVWLERIKVKPAEGEVDPKVRLALELHAEGTKNTIIASRVGRSVQWVRNTIRAGSQEVAQSASLPLRTT
jgi:hypothetical protein